jgi:hypothetical protein
MADGFVKKESRILTFQKSRSTQAGTPFCPVATVFPSRFPLSNAFFDRRKLSRRVAKRAKTNGDCYLFDPRKDSNRQ